MVIDIIIPVYNAAKTLPRCLDSVRAQTYDLWRAILVDDASDDGSIEILRAYAKLDSRFVLLQQPKNQGAAAARNRALQQLSGEYVAFLDADDWWEADMLASLYHEAVRCNADIVQCRYQYDYPSGKSYVPAGVFGKSCVLEKENFKKIYIRMMTGINMNHVCMKLIRRSLLDGVVFDSSLATGEDLDFCMKLFKRASNYVFLPQILYHYYRGGGGLTGKGLSKKQKWVANQSIVRRMLLNLRDWGIETPKYRILSRMRPYFIAISKLLRIGRERLFLRKEGAK